MDNMCRRQSIVLPGREAGDSLASECSPAFESKLWTVAGSREDSMNTACMLEKTDKYTQCLSCPSWPLVCEGGDEAPDTDLLLCFPKVEEDRLQREAKKLKWRVNL